MICQKYLGNRENFKRVKMGIRQQLKAEFKEDAGCIGGLMGGILDWLMKDPQVQACCFTCLAIIVVPIWLFSLPLRLFKAIYYGLTNKEPPGA